MLSGSSHQILTIKSECCSRNHQTSQGFSFLCSFAELMTIDGLLQLHCSGMLFCILWYDGWLIQLLCLPTSFSSLVILWPLVSTSPHHSLESLEMVVLENDPSWSTVSERLSLACPLNPFSSPLWCWLWTSSGHQWSIAEAAAVIG